MYSDGFMDKPVTVTHHKRDTGEEYTSQSNVGAGVHSAYESKMVDRKSTEILEGVQAKLNKMPEKFAPIDDGKDAAKAIVHLMDRAATRLPPKELIQTFIDAGSKANNKAYDALWRRWGDDTVDTIADGARVLAFIWDAAWMTGDGSKIHASQLGAVDTDALQEVYTEDATFVPSLDLDDIDAALGLVSAVRAKRALAPRGRTSNRSQQPHASRSAKRTGAKRRG